jgi:uncharacterized membrane protein
MAFFHAKTRLDKAFEISLLLKGLDGLIETLGGVFFLFIHPDRVTRFAEKVTTHNPHSFLGRHILEWAQGFTKGAAIFAALYLLSHGLVKLVLVGAILEEHLWAYPGLVIVTIGFVAYQIYHMAANGLSAGYLFLTLFDLLVIYLTTKEYGHQKERLRKIQAEREEAA